MKTLADIADDNGTFAIIAMDQRNTLRRMFDAVGEEATPEVLAQAKSMSLPTSLPVRPGCCSIRISVFRRYVNQANWRRPVGCWWQPSHPIAETTTENRVLIA